MFVNIIKHCILFVMLILDRRRRRSDPFDST
jgi:hypothetical protein